MTAKLKGATFMDILPHASGQAIANYVLYLAETAADECSCRPDSSLACPVCRAWLRLNDPTYTPTQEEIEEVLL